MSIAKLDANASGGVIGDEGMGDAVVMIPWPQVSVMSAVMSGGFCLVFGQGLV